MQRPPPTHTHQYLVFDSHLPLERSGWGFRDLHHRAEDMCRGREEEEEKDTSEKHVCSLVREERRKIQSGGGGGQKHCHVGSYLKNSNVRQTLSQCAL